MNPRLAVGDVAPLFELFDTDGRPVAARPSAKAATVVVFTANDCPYAQAWHNRIQQVARDYAGREVQVLQVVSNDETDHPQDGPDEMRRRVQAGELAGPFLRDTDQRVARAYGATATPEVFVIDPAGVLRYKGAPDANHDDPTADARWVRQALDDILAGRRLRRPVTSPAGCSIKWRVELLWWDGCPSHRQADELLRTTLSELGRDEVAVVHRRIRTRAEAQELAFPGSPTFHVGGRDLFPASTTAALTCRVYRRPDGSMAPLPAPAELADRLRDALARPWELPGWVDFRTPTRDISAQD